MNVRVLAAFLAGWLLASVPALAGEVYNNGPINGNTNAWTINFGYVVTDTFTVSSNNTTLGSLAFGAWLFPGDVLQTVEVLVTSEAFGGTTYFDQVVSFAQSGCVLNQHGYDVCTETGFFDGPTLPNGTYWLELQNAVVNTGDPIYWDENSGTGCTSPGCPSVAQTNNCISNGLIGCIPSEAFTLDSGGATVPEPSSLVLFGTGFFGVIAVVRKKMC
jgi:hypothetical protein